MRTLLKSFNSVLLDCKCTFPLIFACCVHVFVEYAMLFVQPGSHTRLLPEVKVLCNTMKKGGKTRLSHLSCLEVMPFCGFNTRPKRCALVSPAISSNLATLNWILCTGPSVL